MRPLSIRHRIGVLALILVVGSCVAAAALSLTAFRQARDANNVAESTRSTALIVSLRTALVSERIASDLALADGRRMLIDQRNRTDGAVGLFSEEPLPFGLLNLARQQFDQGEVRRSLQIYDDAIATLDDALDPAIQEARANALSSHDQSLFDATEALEASMRRTAETADVVTAFTDFLAADEGIDLAIARSDLARASASTQLGEHLSPIADVLDRAIDGDLSGDERPRGAEADELVRNGLLVVESAATDTMAAADELTERATAAARSERIWAAIVVIAVSAALVTVLWVTRAIARSITEPLRLVSNAARRLERGELDLDDLPKSGTPEIVDLAEAIDETARNLRQLEQAATTVGSGSTTEVDTVGFGGGVGEALRKSLDAFNQSIEVERRLRSQIEHEASHDHLTGVLNRDGALERLESAVNPSSMNDQFHLITIDIDEFGDINDVYGFEIGDRVLRTVIQHLQGATIDGIDWLARTGPDQFAVGLQSARPRRWHEHFTSSLRSSRWPGDATITVCTGITAARSGESPLTLLRRSEQTVEAARRRGADTMIMHEDDLLDDDIQRRAIEADLRQSLVGGEEFYLNLQPVVAARSLVPIGAEALLRWSPSNGAVSPAVFIPVAERSPLIVDIDNLVVERVMQQLAEWSQEPDLADLRININLSPRTLTRRTIVDTLASAMVRHGIRRGRLVIEVTETAVVENYARIIGRLRQLSGLGIGIALDDFGTGFTGFSHLRSMPLDVLKIDRSIVEAAENSERERRSIVLLCDFAETIGATVVAEGVEHQRQAEMLIELGCHQLQGFGIARPDTPAATVNWIRSGWSRTTQSR